MSFCDRFVLALYFGLAQYLPVGRDAALRILDRATAKGRLSLSELNDASLVLLLALLPATSTHRLAVRNLVASRGLDTNPIGLIQLLQAAGPVRLNAFLEVSRPPVLQLRQLVLDALSARNQLGVVEDLCLYLGRLYLRDPSGPQLQNLAEGWLAGSARRYVRIPLGTVDFQVQLYRLVRSRALSPSLPPPTAIPTGPRPVWFLNLETMEQQFIDACLLYLPLSDVDLLYLHIYARLSAAQIALVLHRPQPGAVDAIVHQLEACWNAVL